MFNIPEGTRVPSFTVHEVRQALIIIIIIIIILIIIIIIIITNLQWHFHEVALHPLFPDRIGI